MSHVSGLLGSWGDFSLEIPALEILDRGVTALWGPSGSGKSLVLRILSGLEPCSSLNWHWGEEDLASIPLGERHIGYMLQGAPLFWHMTVRDNVLFPARARGLSAQQVKFTKEWALEALELGPLWQQQAQTLSGGERHRVALARALMGNPRILFLDEPFAALDEETKGRLRSGLKERLDCMNLPVVIVTHDRGDVEFLAHQMIGLRQGRLTGEFLNLRSLDPPEELSLDRG